MADLVERLRAMAQGEAKAGIGRQRRELFDEAAAEIERLRKGNAELLKTVEVVQHSYQERESLWNEMQMRFSGLTDEIKRLQAELVTCGELLDADLLARAVKAEAEIERLRAVLDAFGSSRVRDRVAARVGCNHDILHDVLQAEVAQARHPGRALSGDGGE